jgi:hypothetical protein
VFGGQSVIEVAVLVIQKFFLDGPSQPADSPPRPHGQSSWCLWMVRLVLRRVVKSFDS